MALGGRRRSGQSNGPALALRMLLFAGGAVFVLLQGRFFFRGSSVRANSGAVASERDWSSEAQELRDGLSNLSQVATALEGQYQNLRREYDHVSEALKIAQQSLEEQRKRLRGGSAQAGRTDAGGGATSAASHEEKTSSSNGVATDSGQPELRPQDAVAAVVVMACNRPQYLQRTIKSILEVHNGQFEKFPLFISQDGTHAGVKALGLKQTQFHYLQHIEDKPPVMNSPNEIIAYYRIANHYKFALSKLFDEKSFSRVIILEDDMELSPDFFDYFEATAELLDTDPSLMAVSSWNDNGQEQFVSDPEALYRSDFFPGLGWMMRRQLWEELAPKWPKAYWDDWMRLPEHRKGRQSLRPEVCRTYNFGEVGSSFGQFFRDFLAPIKLNTKKVNWKGKDLSYLHQAAYEGELLRRVRASRRVSSVGELAGVARLEEDVAVGYSEEGTFAAVAQTLGIFREWKAGIPRTSYRGVVTIRYKGPHLVYIVNWNLL